MLDLAAVVVRVRGRAMARRVRVPTRTRTRTCGWIVVAAGTRTLARSWLGLSFSMMLVPSQ